MMTRVEMFRDRLGSLNISDYHGLNSPGVTCYLNSVLQVLFMTEDFREAVKGCSSEDSTAIDEHLRSLFSDLESRVARTHNIAKNLGIANVYEQRDAAEYFEKILCRTSPEAAKMFKGELNHMTTCLKCKKRSDSRGCFWMLPLPVEDLSGQSYSVEKGLRAFFEGERACGDNKVYCNRCTQKQDADFGREMTQNPEVLTLLLKRFTFDHERGRYVKLHCNVHVPQFLHVEDCDYDLYALVNHFGNLTGGHYTAQIKSFETQVWYNFNDSIVKGVKPPFGDGDESLRSSTAYLLMYRKVRRNPEKITEGDQAALCAYPDVEIERIYEQAEKGAALVPRHRPEGVSCNGGGNVKRWIGDESKKTCRVAAVSKAALNFGGEVEKLPRQTAGDGRRTRSQARKSNSAKLQEHEQQTSRQLDARSNEHMHLSDTRGTPRNVTVCETEKKIHRKAGTKTSGTDGSLARNRVKRAEVGTGGKSSEQRREAAASPKVHHYDVTSLHISSNGCSYSPHKYLTGDSQSRCHANEPSEPKYSADRKSSRSKKDAEHALTAGSSSSSCKLDRIQRVTKGEKSKSQKEKCCKEHGQSQKRAVEELKQ